MMYRSAVWNAYVQWMAGELDILPRLHAAWLTWAHTTHLVDVVTIAERWAQIESLLKQPQPPPGLDTPGVADRLIERFEDLTLGAGLVALDIKPNDMLL